jgi:hypothetical protein
VYKRIRFCLESLVGVRIDLKPVPIPFVHLTP